MRVFSVKYRDGLGNLLPLLVCTDRLQATWHFDRLVSHYRTLVIEEENIGKPDLPKANWLREGF